MLLTLLKASFCILDLFVTLSIEYCELLRILTLEVRDLLLKLLMAGVVIFYLVL